MLKNFHNPSYGGSVQFPGGSARFDVAEQGDIPRLAGLYRQISVTEENYREKFDPQSERSFGREGGMFVVHDLESIRIALRDSFFAVARRQGRIEASFWVTGTDPDFEAFTPDRGAFPEEAPYLTLCSAIKAGRVLYPRELIVAADAGIPKVSLLLFYTIFQAARRWGYTHSLGVVYQLRGWSEDGKAHPLFLRNQRSFEMTRSTGGLVIGTLPVRQRSIGRYAVLIEPIIFDFDYSIVLPHLQEVFEQKGIRVQSDWGESQ